VLGASRRRQLQPIKRVSLNGKRYPKLLHHRHSYAFDPPFRNFCAVSLIPDKAGSHQRSLKTCAYLSYFSPCEKDISYCPTGVIADVFTAVFSVMRKTR